MSNFEDFVPEGKEKIGAKTLFQDFIPEPTVEEIEKYNKARVAKNKAKEKVKVILTDEDKKAIEEMENESIEENGAIAPEIPTEGEIGLPPEGGNGTPPEEVKEEVLEQKVEPKKSQKRR